jgi:hypothetical protein
LYLIEGVGERRYRMRRKCWGDVEGGGKVEEGQSECTCCPRTFWRLNVDGVLSKGGRSGKRRQLDGTDGWRPASRSCAAAAASASGLKRKGASPASSGGHEEPDENLDG